MDKMKLQEAKSSAEVALYAGSGRPKVSRGRHVVPDLDFEPTEPVIFEASQVKPVPFGMSKKLVST